MNVEEMVARSQDAATVARVYGEPQGKDGTTVIPAARVSARGGSGAARGGEHSGGRVQDRRRACGRLRDKERGGRVEARV